jgi:hypothetical protein
MNKLTDTVKEEGIINVVQILVEHFDKQADFSNLSGNKKQETKDRKVVSILIDALNKIDSIL